MSASLTLLTSEPSLTLAAPAGYRDPTPSSALGERADSTLMQETEELRPLSQFYKAREKDTPTS